MKLQRENTYKGKMIKSIAAVLLASTVLSGCGCVDTCDELNASKDRLTSNEIIESTTLPDSTLEPMDPTPEPMLDPTPEPMMDPTPEPTLEPNSYTIMEEEHSVFDEQIEVNEDDEISMLGFALLTFKGKDGEEKVIPVIRMLLNYDNDVYNVFYDIYTGKLVYSAIIAFQIDCTYIVIKVEYVDSNFKESELTAVGSLLDYCDLFFKSSRLTDEEYVAFNKKVGELVVIGTYDDQVFHPINVYHQFYQDAIPDRYKVDSYELFGENDKVMVKGN